jgi:hypothetical protein
MTDLPEEMRQAAARGDATLDDLKVAAEGCPACEPPPTTSPGVRHDAPHVTGTRAAVRPMQSVVGRSPDASKQMGDWNACDRNRSGR